MLLRRLTYVSRVSPSVAETDLRHIVGLAEVLHRRRDLSGVLAYTGRNFLQVIEGAVKDVEWLVTLIRDDPRHSQMHVLCDETVSRRIFDHWCSLQVETPDLIDKVAAALAPSTTGSDQARELTQRLVNQLRADGRMR